MSTIMNTLLLGVIVILCGCSSPNKDESINIEAKYILPYPVGTSYTCSLTFNSSPSHVGTFKYSVDFSMPIGTVVTAARSGRVVYVLEGYLDSDPTEGHENVVVVRHEDSTYSRYAHLTSNGARVVVGQLVSPGDTVGLSGNSGSSAASHLHFDVTRSNTGRNDQTIPFDCRNTIPHPVGFQQGVRYQALQY
jgi:murein DD-endopeptidase MepM/ murein hydrolase activator NlpD